MSTKHPPLPGGIFTTVYEPMGSLEELKTIIQGENMDAIIEDWRSVALNLLASGGFRYPAALGEEALAELKRRLEEHSKAKGKLQARLWDKLDNRARKLRDEAGIIPHDAERKYLWAKDLLGHLKSIETLFAAEDYAGAIVHALYAGQIAVRLQVLPLDSVVRQARMPAAAARSAKAEKDKKKSDHVRALYARFRGCEPSKTATVERIARELTTQTGRRVGARGLWPHVKGLS